MENDLLFEIENETIPLNQGGRESLDTKEDHPGNGQNPSFMSPFFVELIYRIKSSIGSIKNLVLISRGKFSDHGFGEYFYRSTSDDIEKVDVVLNGLLNYIKVNTPINKTNTVHNLIEEVLKKNQAKLEEKGIKIFQKFEKDLPETIVPDEQLRYILNSVFQYVVASTLSNGNIGFLTKSLVLEKTAGRDPSLPKKDEQYIEISVMMGHKKVTDRDGRGFGIPTPQKEQPLDLLLRLVKEIVLSNRGMMRMEVDDKKARSSISLRFPVEKRKVVYYQSTSE